MQKESAFIDEHSVIFLNQLRSIASSQCWNEVSCDKLWLYNLHYFDDLNAENAAVRTIWHRQLIERWINENPMGLGNGWEAYPTSLRIVNWLKWSLSGNVLTAKMQQSLVWQTRHLFNSLEWHLLGNHLLANAKALIFSGLFFDSFESTAWLKKGLSIFNKQLPEQVLEDGAHFELSPMYQGIIIEDLLDLINLYTLYQQAIPESWPIALKKMFRWLQGMNHPDGEMAFFNDATLNISASLAVLITYAESLGLTSIHSLSDGLHHFKASGYVRMQQSDAVLLADIAAVGPTYLPGHAHADTLSFELSVKGQRVFVNAGISTYATTPLRAYQRSTAAHNTLEIDAANSSEVWGAFRVARRAQVMNVTTHEDALALVLQASHNGYQRLKGMPIHTRQWRLLGDRLTINDSVASNESHDVKVYFHFHSSLVLTRLDSRECLLSDSEDRAIATFSATENFSIESGFFYPAFNQQIANQCIVIHRAKTSAFRVTTELKWN